MENELTNYTDAELFRLAGVVDYPDTCEAVELDGMSAEELQADYGMTRQESRKAKAIIELAKRWLRGRVKRGSMCNSSACAVEVFEPYVHNLKQELFLVGLLNAKNEFLDVVEISRGSLTSSVVHPREVFRPAIKHGAASVIACHNHPSGDPKPSKEDRALTARLQDVGEQIGIEFLDHVIIGEGRYISFADEGWLAPSKLF